MKDSVNERITVNEVTNNGHQVHLYYDPTKKEYLAYGYSAYIVTHTDLPVMPTYSDDLQMPMVVVSDTTISKLKKKLDEIMFIEDEYYLFEAEKPINENDYTRWATQIRGEA